MMGTNGDKVRLGFLLLAIGLNVWPVGSEPQPDSAREHAWAPVPDHGDSVLASGSAHSSSFVAASRLQMYDFEKDTDSRWTLPKELDEISGLARTEDGRILAHSDEKGTVFVLDPQQEKIDKVFTLWTGATAVNDDFEGIAVVGDRIYMVSSTGRIYEFSEGADGSRVAFRTHETGLGTIAEVEGLAYEPSTEALLLACKEHRGAALAASVVIYSWSIAAKELVDAAPLEIAISQLCAGTKEKKFHASGIERDAITGHYFLVAARQALVAEVTAAGDVVAVRELPDKRHRQAEGITFTMEEALVISDEADGKNAVLTIYPVAGH